MVNTTVPRNQKVEELSAIFLMVRRYDNMAHTPPKQSGLPGIAGMPDCSAVSHAGNIGKAAATRDNRGAGRTRWKLFLPLF